MSSVVGLFAVVGAARPNVAFHLAGVQGLVGDLEDQVGPEHVQHQQENQETVEDVVGWKHRHDFWSINRCTVTNDSVTIACNQVPRYNFWPGNRIGSS